MDNSATIIAFNMISSQWQNTNNTSKYFIKNKFDLSKQDFDVSLLPFNKLPQWDNIPEYLKNKVLSIGWLLYQQKTIQIETQVVTPACIDILNQQLPISSHVAIKTAMAETLVDESYHTHLGISSCQNVLDNRQLSPLFVTDFKLTHNRRKLLNSLNSSGDRRLASVAIACCSETLITDYLHLLSGNVEIQPQLAQAVKVHADDEMMHERIFFLLAKELSGQLTQEAKILFFHVVELAESWFKDPELDAWIVALRQINNSELVPLIVEIEKYPEKLYSNIKRNPALHHFIQSLSA